MSEFFGVPTLKLGDDRLLVREVLIERRDIDAGSVGDSVVRV